jgi:pyruvate,water dikinase
VTSADALPAPGAVLVVRTLDPRLAPLLPGLRGLVSETGSVLSHLAILARELGVPTVVGVPDAVARFAPGATVVVDGSSGEVHETDARVPVS